MPGILVMAALTICLTALLCLKALNHLTGSNRQFYWLLLAGLPLSLIVNGLIKSPVIAALAAWTGIPLKLGPDMPLWFIMTIWFNAPIFEESIKLVPLVLPVSRFLLRDTSQAIWAGLALGMGFGLGEAAYIAYGVAQSPAYNQLPWYMFMGFASERLLVTFAHGLMTSLAAAGFAHGKRNALTGYLAAVGLHALINLGPLLLALKWIPAAVASLGTYTAILLAFVMVQKKIRDAKKVNGGSMPQVVYFER